MMPTGNDKGMLLTIFSVIYVVMFVVGMYGSFFVHLISFVVPCRHQHLFLIATQNCFARFRPLGNLAETNYIT